jgi:hypothetical protein
MISDDTIQEAKRVWFSLPDPTPNAVSEELAELGYEIKEGYVALLARFGWERSAIEGSEEAAASVPPRGHTIEQIEGETDQSLIRMMAKTQAIAVIRIGEAFAIRSYEIVKKDPSNAARLLQALARATESALKSYEHTVMLAERVMKMLNDREGTVEGTVEPTPTAAATEDPLASSLNRFRLVANSLKNEGVRMRKNGHGE